MPSRAFKVEIYTPTSTVATSEALHVRFPASDGQVGILGGRAPMVAMLGVGMTTLYQRGGTEEDYFVSRGFARMEENRLIFLAEECVPAGQLSAEDAYAELEQARQIVARTREEEDARERIIAEARAKFDAAQQYRRKRGLVRPPLIEE